MSICIAQIEFDIFFNRTSNWVDRTGIVIIGEVWLQGEYDQHMSYKMHKEIIF